ncbi:MAG: MarR family transcriptional regulator [Alphaproteobacteria bacterium]|nr:MarR family transcriptional regulator [Alphaproteobacteria bacterium]
MSKKNIKVTHQQLEELRQSHIGKLFLQAHRNFSLKAIKKLRLQGHENLGLSHTGLLANLDIQGTNMITLATRMGISKQAVGKLAKELEDKGYVQITADPDDKRATRLIYTKMGDQFLYDAHQIKQEIETEYTAILGKKNMETLRALLKKLLTQSGSSEF